ncbi:MAG: hypothetical protein QHH14_12765 [Clostridiales bacterium]|nr:hypothetical protein [Clostridiales bacterium]
MKKEKLYRMPYHGFFLAYIFILIFVSFRVYMAMDIFSAAEFLFKSLYIPFCFYLCFVYFQETSDAKTLFLAFVVSVIFPLLFIYFQKMTGYTWRYHETRGLIRSQAVYHSVISPRIFIMQALIGIYLYWQYFVPKARFFLRGLLIFLSIACVVGLYFLYSKAIILTLIIWAVIFSFLGKKLYILPLAFIFFLITNSLLGNRVFEDMRTLFSKEIDYVAGSSSVSRDYLLSGRIRIWSEYAKEWKDLSLLEKLIGTGRSHSYFHDDFLRVLYSGGVLLLVLYGTMLIIFFTKALSLFQRTGEIVYFSVLLGLSYYLAETFGQTPGFYPIIQPMTWGLIGLSLNKSLTRPETENILKQS